MWLLKELRVEKASNLIWLLRELIFVNLTIFSNTDTVLFVFCSLCSVRCVNGGWHHPSLVLLLKAHLYALVCTCCFRCRCQETLNS